MDIVSRSYPWVTKTEFLHTIIYLYNIMQTSNENKENDQLWKSANSSDTKSSKLTQSISFDRQQGELLNKWDLGSYGVKGFIDILFNTILTLLWRLSVF